MLLLSDSIVMYEVCTGLREKIGNEKEGRKGGACVRSRVAALPIAVSAPIRLQAVGIHAQYTCTLASVTFGQSRIPSACLSHECSGVQHCAHYSYYCRE